MAGGHMSVIRGEWRTRLLVLAFSVLIAASVFGISTISRTDLNADVESTRAAEAMLRARLDRETGLRGYLNTADPSFLEPYQAGVGTYRQAAAKVRAQMGGDRKVAPLMRELDALTRSWERSAKVSLERVRGGDRELRTPEARA